MEADNRSAMLYAHTSSAFTDDDGKVHPVHAREFRELLPAIIEEADKYGCGTFKSLRRTEDEEDPGV